MRNRRGQPVVLGSVRRLILWALVCSGLVSVVNIAVATYYVTQQDFHLMWLALGRLVFHLAGIVLLLMAQERTRCAMALYREETGFLKQWILESMQREREREVSQ